MRINVAFRFFKILASWEARKWSRVPQMRIELTVKSRQFNSKTKKANIKSLM